MNLIDKVDNLLLEKEGRKRTSHYPSDITACNRQLYYKWVSMPKSNPMEAGAIWKMEFGNAIHELFGKWLQGLNISVETEVPIKQQIGQLKYPISGRIDNIFIDPDTGDKCGIEVKTSFGRGIKQIQKLQQPKEEHLWQVAIYLNLTDDIKRFYLVYIGRDNSYRTQFEITEYDKTHLKIMTGGRLWGYDFQTIILKLSQLENCIEEIILPDRSYQAAIKNGEIKGKFQYQNQQYKSDWQCVYCQWRNLCWASELDKYKNSNNSGAFNG